MYMHVYLYYFSSSIILCIIIIIAPDCGPLTPPANGDVDTSSGTTAGSVALYSCNEGFVLTGTADRVCGSDGRWRPDPPACEGV